MSFFEVEPEVPGGFGEDTVLDHDTGRLRVHYLHFEFAGWLGDELVTAHPVFACTTSLAERFARARLSGYELRPMKVSWDEQYELFHPPRQLPDFVELLVTGTALTDDFGIVGNGYLIMSEFAVAVLNTTNPVSTDIKPFAPIGGKEA